MAVLHIFISINESASIINLTLLSVVALDNRQVTHITESYGTPVVGKHIFASGETF